MCGLNARAASTRDCAQREAGDRGAAELAGDDRRARDRRSRPSGRRRSCCARRRRGRRRPGTLRSRRRRAGGCAPARSRPSRRSSRRRRRSAGSVQEKRAISVCWASRFHGRAEVPAVGEPALLLGAEEASAPGRPAPGSAASATVFEPPRSGSRAGLHVAVLAVVEQVDARQRGPSRGGRRCACRCRAAAPTWETACAPSRPDRRRRAARAKSTLEVLALQAGVVVRDLVVVPDHQPRRRCVRRLQRRVALVGRVAGAVLARA